MGVPYVEFMTDRGDGIVINSYQTYGLILTRQDIGLPKVRTNYIKIEGRNGSLDMSEIYNSVFYDNRTLTFTFSTVSSIYEWDELRTRIANDLHGQLAYITTYSDSQYRYVGRCSVDKYQSSKGLGTITIKCECEPFKTLPNETAKDFTLGTDTPITIEESFTVLGIPVKILLNTTGATSDVTFQIDNWPTLTLNPNTSQQYEYYTEQGEHTIKVTGQGTASISYQEQII